MSTSPTRVKLATALAVAALTAGAAAHVPLQPPGTIAVQVDLQVGGAPYWAKGGGECDYSADASIHQAPGQMWSVRRRDGVQDVSFTLWRLRNGRDMFTMYVTAAGKSHRVNTLQVGPSADRRGSGTATFAQRGKGGQFTIDALADTGAKVAGTLACSGFTSPEQNGN